MKVIPGEKVLALDLSDKSIRGLQNPTGTVAADTARMEIDKIMRNRDHAYHRPELGQAHKESVAAVNALHEIAYDDGSEPVEVTGLLRR